MHTACDYNFPVISLFSYLFALLGDGLLIFIVILPTGKETQSI